MVEQREIDEKIGLDALVEDIKQIPLPEKLSSYQRVIVVRLREKPTTQYEFIFSNGKLTINTFQTVEPDLIFEDNESTIIKIFTGEKVDIPYGDYIRKDGTVGWPLGDVSKFFTYIANVKQHLRSISPNKQYMSSEAIENREQYIKKQSVEESENLKKYIEITLERSITGECIHCGESTNRYISVPMHKVLDKKLVRSDPLQKTYQLRYDSKTIEIPSCEECAKFIKEEKFRGDLQIGLWIGLVLFAGLSIFIIFKSRDLVNIILTCVCMALSVGSGVLLYSRRGIKTKTRSEYEAKKNKKIDFCTNDEYKPVSDLLKDGWQFGTGPKKG